MFVQPVDAEKTPDKTAWDNITVYAGGRFVAFFGTGRKSEGNPGAYPTALDVYESQDGVHWRALAKDALPVPGAHAGFGVLPVGEWFYYYPTCSDGGRDVRFRVFRTKDFAHWESMGDGFDVRPDRAWYRERWDELMVLPDTDGEGRPVFYGYISSETREDIGEPGAGMLRSYDGVRWEVLPPVEVDWDGFPGQHMELNFVEKIGERYYLSMSGRAYMDSHGYSLYTFVGDSPSGPFAPDKVQFRLAGTTRREVTWLGHTVRAPQGLLVALWLSHAKAEIPSQSFALGSLKRLECHEGHLRLGYWEGNEAAKGAEVPLDPAAAALAHPDPKTRTGRDGAAVDAGTGAVELSASRDGAILLFGERFDRNRGFILEGRLCARENRGHIMSHQHGAWAGFYIEEHPGAGTAMLASTLGVTRTGALRYADHRITDCDEYAHASACLVAARSGPLQGTLEFVAEDTVGPFGHAAMCGIRHGREHAFRLLARGDYFEVYVDGVYVQTWLLPEGMTGRVGLCALDGTCRFEALRAWEMSF